MTSCLLGLCLSFGLGPDPGKPAPVLFFAAEEWYRKAPGEEKEYEGTVDRTPGGGQLGVGRFNTYRLLWNDSDGNQHARELHTPGKTQLLAVHLGQKVRVIGKAVDTKVEGKTYLELWPARLETLGLTAPDQGLGILARCEWQPDAGRQQLPSTWTIKDGSVLAQHCRLFGQGVEQAAADQLAKKLGVAVIDWKKQMLVTVSAGLRINGERLRITRVSLANRILTVSYRLEPVSGEGGLSFPAETVLVERFNGDVRFEAETK